jgi:translation elongation factor EF-G
VSSGEKKKIKVPRLVRMHSDEMEDVDEVRQVQISERIVYIECE